MHRTRPTPQDAPVSAGTPVHVRGGPFSRSSTASRRRPWPAMLSGLALATVTLLGGTGCVVESAGEPAPTARPMTATTMLEEVTGSCVVLHRIVTARSTGSGNVAGLLVEVAATAPPDVAEAVHAILDAEDVDTGEDAWDTLGAWAARHCDLRLDREEPTTARWTDGTPPASSTQRVRFADVLAAVAARSSEVPSDDAADVPWWEDDDHVGTVAVGADSLTIGVHGVADPDVALTVCRDIVEALAGVRPTVLVWVRDRAGDLSALSPTGGCRASAGPSGEGH